MPENLKRFYGPAVVTAAAATVYSALPAETCAIRHIRICNTSSVPRAFTLSLGADAVGTRLFAAQPIPALDSLDWSGLVVVNPNDIIQAYADVTGVVTLTISGVSIL